MHTPQSLKISTLCSTNYKDSMTPELNWCGWPIGPGESYGGKPDAVAETCGEKTLRLNRANPAAKHYELITESDVAEVFGNGAYNFHVL